MTTPSEPTPQTPNGSAGPRLDRALVLEVLDEDGRSLCETLSRAGVAARSCRDLRELLAEIPRDTAVVVVAEEVLAAEQAAGFVELLAKQPAWSELPVLLLAGGDAWPPALRPHLESLQKHAQLSVLSRPPRNAALVSVVRSAVRSRQRQYQRRDELFARQQAEAALRESEHRLSLAQFAGNVGVFDWDLVSGEVYWTPELERLHGLAPGTFGGNYDDWAKSVHADDLARLTAFFDAWLASGEPSRSWEYRFYHARSGLRWMEARGRLVFDPEGRPVRIIGTNLDISERKWVEDSMRELNDDLERQVAERAATAERRARDLRRLAARLGRVQHEERTRLARILHDHLQQLLVAAKIQVSSLGRARPELSEDLTRIEDLLGESLDASRTLTVELSPPILQQGSLIEALGWLCEFKERKHGLVVTRELSTDLPDLPEHLRIFLFQFVRELLFNVVKHAGVLQARLSLRRLPRGLMIEVADRGHGFDPEAVERQLEHPDGFGLFHIREQMEALEGRLEIGVTDEGGARFRLVVPDIFRTAGDANAKTAPKKELPAPAAAAGGAAHDGEIQLLVVDDHSIVREGIVGLLQSQPDFTVIGEAADGEEAIQKAALLRPDVIIMDVNMPRLDGITATRRILEQQPDSRILGLSLLEEDSYAQSMLEAGALAFLCKDGPGEKLFAAIRAVV